LALFEDTIGDMVINCGAAVRSLLNNNNTVLLSDFIDANEEFVMGSNSKVYVFKHKYVKACIRGKSNKNMLLTEAKIYLF
jgi:hypothetical protein